MNVNQEVTSETAYACPVALLPATSQIPSAQDDVAGHTLENVSREALASLLQGVIAETAQIVARWQQAILIPAWIERETTGLAQLLDTLASTLQATRAGHLQKVAHEQSLDPQQMAASDMSQIMAEACAIYDNYFRVERVHLMALDTFIGQVVETARHILHDLPYTLLDQSQISQLMLTIGAMFSTLQTKLPHQDRVVPTLPLSPCRSVTLSSWHTAWLQEEVHTPAWTEQVSHYRWKVGHHFFDLCTIFCADNLQLASCTISDAVLDEEAIATAVLHLQQAEIFLRGTTAAIWYAGDFPTSIYQQIIRPSMVMPSAPAGFSGDQNADHSRMKQAKQQLKKRLRAHYSNTLATMPANLYNAFMSFHEADIEDNEHHLLIAAHKVGADQSLAQKEWQAELPDLIHKQTAIDVLREMAERKRREFLN